MSRWAPEEFEKLRHVGDPELDEAVERYLEEHDELASAREGVGAVIRELAVAKQRARTHGDGASAILDELGDLSGLPDWARDEALLERGQRVFQENGLYQAGVLFCAALPLAYVHESSALVLAGVSDLGTKDLTRRVAETGQMLVDVMGLRGPDSLKPGGPGYTSAVGLRVLHSFVRALVRERQREDKWDKGWDDTEHGAPVNQELLTATLIDFSAVTWRAMARLGVELTEEEKNANLYTWSVFGHLMGVAACREEPLTLSDSEQIMEHFSGTLVACEEGRRLMAALLAEMESFMFLGWRKLPRSLIRWIFTDWGNGVERVPDLLGVPKAAWWATPLLATARWAGRRERVPDPVRPLARLLMRRAARSAIIWFADRHSGGSAPFQVPPDLARSWRIPRSPTARRVARARGRVRRAVRAPRSRSTARGRTPAAA